MTPPPTIPRCCNRHRADALSALETLIANDAAGCVLNLIEGGASIDEAVWNATSGYRDYLVANINDAISMGVAWAETSLREATA